MAKRIPVNPGDVEWCGDNPGIYLKTNPEGDWSVLAIFFRIMLSPFGRGHTMIVLDSPNEEVGYPEKNNFCLTDNNAMTDYLLSEFLAKFPSFKDKAGVKGMTRLALDTVKYEGDMKTVYREVVTGEGVEAIMQWNNMQEPMAVEVSPRDCATGEHDMYSVFLEAADASVIVNGEALPGQVVDRQFFGKTMSTAFLAVSETWVKPNQGSSV